MTGTSTIAGLRTGTPTNMVSCLRILAVVALIFSSLIPFGAYWRSTGGSFQDFAGIYTEAGDAIVCTFQDPAGTDYRTPIDYSTPIDHSTSCDAGYTDYVFYASRIDFAFDWLNENIPSLKNLANLILILNSFLLVALHFPYRRLRSSYTGRCDAARAALAARQLKRALFLSLFLIFQQFLDELARASLLAFYLEIPRSILLRERKLIVYRRLGSAAAF